MKLRNKKINQAPPRKSLNRSIPQSKVQTQINRVQKAADKRRDVSLSEALEKLYIDVQSAPSFSAKINAFLRSNHVHSVHRRITKKIFPRRKIIARFPFDIFMADLIEYPQYKYQNRQYVYILIVIDCFTKKVYAVPMKKKSMQWTADAFESIFKTMNEFPIHLITDGGLGKIVSI